MPKEMICKECTMPGHTAFICPLRKHVLMKRKKALSKVGKIGKQYKGLREKFFAANPGDPWYCYYCLSTGTEIPLEKSQVNVEHFYSKARHPELRFDVGNLVASCAWHNKDKGSKDGPEYLEQLKERVDT